LKSVLIAPDLKIPLGEVEFKYIRASGPGGQNVNKVATACQLRFNITQSQSLPSHVKERLKIVAKNQINKEGNLIITARRYRLQTMNREEALERLAGLVRKALYRPKKRFKTKPSAQAKEKRLQMKKRRSQLKRMRRKPGIDN